MSGGHVADGATRDEKRARLQQLHAQNVTLRLEFPGKPGIHFLRGQLLGCGATEGVVLDVWPMSFQLDDVTGIWEGHFPPTS